MENGVVDSKKCAKCKGIKSLECFAVKLANSDGRYSYCKECVRAEYWHKKLYSKEMRLIQDEPGEIWRDAVGYGGVYMVSNIGRIKRVNKRGLYSVFEHLVSTPIGSVGYPKVGLTINNKTNHTNLHLLVWDAFGDCARDRKDFVVDHIDNDKTNNNIENLQYISIRLNASKDRVRKYGNPLGVYKSKKRWTSKIHYDGRSHYIGSFETKEAASIAYQNKVKELSIKAA